MIGNTRAVPISATAVCACSCVQNESKAVSKMKFSVLVDDTTVCGSFANFGPLRRENEKTDAK